MNCPSTSWVSAVIALLFVQVVIAGGLLLFLWAITTGRLSLSTNTRRSGQAVAGNVPRSPFTILQHYVILSSILCHLAVRVFLALGGTCIFLGSIASVGVFRVILVAKGKAGMFTFSFRCYYACVVLIDSPYWQNLMICCVVCSAALPQHYLCLIT